MILDNENDNPKVHEWIARYTQNGSLAIVTNYFTIGALAYLSKHTQAKIGKYRFVLGDFGNFTLNAWDVNSERKPDDLYFTSICRFKGLERNVVMLVLDEETQFMGNKQFYT